VSVVKEGIDNATDRGDEGKGTTGIGRARSIEDGVED
jgi:hypothetical protein